MKIRLLHLILALASGPCFAMSNSDYAKLGAAFLTDLKTADDVRAVILEDANEKDRPVLQQYFKLHPFHELLKVKAVGDMLQFSGKTQVWRIQIVDGALRIYKYHGVEFELPDALTPQERIHRLESVFAPLHAEWWQWLIPSAYAYDDADDNTPPEIEAALQAQIQAADLAAKGRDKFEAINSAWNAISQVDGLCYSRTEAPNAKTSTAFSDDSNAKIQKMLANKKLKKKPQPSVSDWTQRALDHLNASHDSYCTHTKLGKVWDWLADKANKPTHYFHLPGNGEDATVRLYFNLHSEKALSKMNACGALTHAAVCLKNMVDNHIQSPLYPEQDQQLTQWLVKIQRPDGLPPAATSTQSAATAHSSR